MFSWYSTRSVCSLPLTCFWKVLHKYLDAYTCMQTEIHKDGTDYHRYRQTDRQIYRMNASVGLNHVIADDEFCSWRFISMNTLRTTTVLCSTPWSETLTNWGNLLTNRGQPLVFFVGWIELHIHECMYAYNGGKLWVMKPSWVECRCVVNISILCSTCMFRRMHRSVINHCSHWFWGWN